MRPHSKHSKTERIFDFRELFQRVDNNFSRKSPSREHLLDNFFDTVVTSAIAKCIDFNIISNRDSENEMLPYFLMANSRSICEDLIFIAYMRKLGRKQSNELATAIHWLKFRRSVFAQTNFFVKNNPLQPTVGVLHPTEQQELEIREAGQGLKHLWKQVGFANIPTVRRLSCKVGLNTTYEYIYHMSSNFVHFNPGQLLRQGWGPEEGPFNFSASHFSNYHSEVCRYLGSILFLGYCYSCQNQFLPKVRSTAIEEITSALRSNVRWPEIVTFEEMNQKFPGPILQAAISLFRDEQSESLPDILSELKGL